MSRRGSWRALVFWPHLIVGCVAGLVVLLMSVTGVLLTYERQMLAASDAKFRSVAPTTDAVPLDPDELAVRFKQAEPKLNATGFTWSADPGAAVVVATRERATRYVDTYTGALLGERPNQPAAFLAGTRAWHRWLALEGEKTRPIGRAITGWSNVLFLFLILSGLVLWWPRALRWPAFKAALVPRFRLPARAREWSWHNVIGFWCAVPLAIVVASAFVISFPWFSKWLVETGGATSIVIKPTEAKLPDGTTAVSAGELLRAAWKNAPDARVISYTPTPARQSVTKFAIDRGTGGEPQKRSTLWLDSVTGAVVHTETFDQQPRGNQWRSIARFAHTGEVAGLWGQSIAGIASAGAVVLGITGFTLTFRRMGRAIKHRRHHKASVTTPRA